MPIYEYETENGERIERVQDLGEWVEVGTVVEIDGMKMTRVMSMPRINVQPDFHITGYQMSPSHPSIKACGLKTDEFGQPLFDGIRDIEKFNTDSQRQNEKDPNTPAYGWDQ